MPRPTLRCLLLSGLASLANVVGAQSLRPLDGPQLGSSTGCYDQARGRTILMGDAYDVWEWDGTRWLPRPFEGPHWSWRTLVHDSARRRTYALGAGQPTAAMLSWVSDGTRWLAQNPATAPASRVDALFVHDAARHEIVMFGGFESATLMPSHATWGFDGAQWHEYQPANRPPARSRSAGAFDSSRQVLVIFGGNPWSIPALQDTWEWNGRNWQVRNSANSPSARTNAAMAFDPLRNRCVLFGGDAPGPTNDTWEYDGSNWLLRTPVGNAPAARSHHTLLFDAQLGEVALLGGSTSAGTQANDHWKWNGTRWQLVSTLPDKPPPRHFAALVSEPGAQGVVMFGGYQNSQHLGDTWRWDGTMWSQLSASGPAPRRSAMLFRMQNSIYLFGGQLQDLPSVFAGETWRQNGNAWTQLNPPNSPTPRKEAGVAYHAATNRVVLFGGFDGTYLGDTWLFDGNTWTQHILSTTPLPRSAPAMTYDPVRTRAVLFGGATNFAQYDDTWQWTGSQWQALNFAVHPPSGQNCMNFDPASQQLILVQSAGISVANAWALDADWHSVPQNATPSLGSRPQMATAPGGRGIVVAGAGNLHAWSATQAFAQNYGSACSSNPPNLSGSTWPVPGSPFSLESGDHDGNALVAFLGASASANLPIAGCTLLVQPGQATAMRLANAAGFAQLAMPLPATATLLGTSLYFQAASLRPSDPAGFVLSAGLQVLIGD